MCALDQKKQLDTAFSAVSDSQIHTLVLGSMPSQLSLQNNQYYGNPQNAFWKIMAMLFEFSDQLPYHERTALLLRRGVGIWDVIAECHRPGSMDSAIDTSSVQVNDFGIFFAQHRLIRKVVFNGQAAYKTFNKHLGKTYLVEKSIDAHVLPSTSPAYAALSFEGKCDVWREALSA